MTDSPRLVSLGDTAFSLVFDGADRADRVIALTAAVRAAGPMPGLVEVVPTLRSVQVIYDPLTTSAARLARPLLALASARPGERNTAWRRWRLPVCYDGPDLDAVAARLGLSAAEVIARHAAPDYAVRMLGFLPGFAYLDGLDPALRLPRRDTPRPRVPAGTVAIAEAMTAVYPADSPGGWHLVGRCPLILFDPGHDPPSPLAAGDRVRFTPIDPAAFSERAAATRFPEPETGEPPR